MESSFPPGPRLPRSAQSFNWMFRPAAFMESNAKRYGDVWALRLLGNTTFVMVSDPELVNGIMTAGPVLLHAGEANGMIGPALLGEQSVLLLDEDAHTTKRKLLGPPFHHERIDGYSESIAAICEQEIASWPSREPIQLMPRMQSITLKAIMRVIFGVTGGAPQERLHARVRALMQWASKPHHMLQIHLAHRRQTALPKSFLEVRDPFDAVLFEEIERARKDPQLAERRDVMAMLLKARYEDGSPMSDRDLRDQMVTLLIQGHQSTASALSWALERLMRHPQAIERLRADIEAGSDEYLDAVFKETLRVRPPIPIAPRKVAREPYQLGPYLLAPGAVVAPSIYMLQRREDLYSEPEQFRPERFLEQPEGKYSWIPFGGGDRHCLGRSFATAEFKEVLRLVVQRVHLMPAELADERIVRRGILLAPGDGVRAMVQERMPASPPVSVAA